MTRPRLLDLFCGAGGCSVGYHRAGFEVVGVDIKPMPRYPFKFIQGEALEYAAAHGHEFDAIHASPPCQAYSVTKSLTAKAHPELVPQTRELLRAIGKPYAIENVPGAPLIDALTLCGTMFGLDVIRHRLFECNPPLFFPPATCAHAGKSTSSSKGIKRAGITRAPTLADGFKFVTVVGHDYLVSEGRQAMGIDWMTRDELSQAIPPAYTEYIGRHLMEVLL